MVDALAVRGTLEAELEWRVAEIRALRNVGAALPSGERERYRRAVLLMLYAHYEGFSKAALLEYVRTINQARLVCEEVSDAVLAGAWSKVFGALSGDQKAKVFKGQLPSDSGLHAMARRREFVERLEELKRIEVRFPEDIIDTESNLWPRQLRRNLYILGLPPEWVDQYEPAVKRLLNMRNAIAHGAERQGLSEPQYAELEAAVLQVMDELMLAIVDAIKQTLFLRPPNFIPPADQPPSP